MLSHAEADLSQWNDFTEMDVTAVGGSNAEMGSWMNFLQPGESIMELNPDPTTTSEGYGLSSQRTQLSDTLTSQSPLPRWKNVIFDVSKLVDGEVIQCPSLERHADFSDSIGCKWCVSGCYSGLQETGRRSCACNFLIRCLLGHAYTIKWNQITTEERSGKTRRFLRPYAHSYVGEGASRHHGGDHVSLEAVVESRHVVQPRPALDRMP
jgi:hypothetical protein